MRPYDSRAWRRRAKQQHRDEPLCVFCAGQDIVRVAEVADHITPHRGDPEAFAGPLQSLCRACHSKRKQQLELTGHFDATARDGRPLDPLHPWHRKKRPVPSGGANE